MYEGLPIQHGATIYHCPWKARLFACQMCTRGSIYGTALRLFSYEGLPTLHGATIKVSNNHVINKKAFFFCQFSLLFSVKKSFLVNPPFKLVLKVLEFFKKNDLPPASGVIWCIHLWPPHLPSRVRPPVLGCAAGKKEAN